MLYSSGLNSLFFPNNLNRKEDLFFGSKQVWATFDPMARDDRTFSLATSGKLIVPHIWIKYIVEK